jgi:hypothetical protein
MVAVAQRNAASPVGRAGQDATFVVGVRDHVLVVKNGKALDAGAETPMWAMVDVVMMAEH